METKYYWCDTNKNSDYILIKEISKITVLQERPYNYKVFIKGKGGK